MALRVCGTSVLFAILSAQFAAAQVRQISGRVTNTQTQEGVPEATVAVIGTEIVAQTNNQGIYQLNAPAGDVSLVFRAIDRRIHARADLLQHEREFSLSLRASGAASDDQQREDQPLHQRPRWKRNLGTFRPFFSAWPRPERLGFDMK